MKHLMKNIYYKSLYLHRLFAVNKLIKKYNIRGKNKLNIILITIECARPDHFSLYGYSINTTPFLSKIENKVAIFTNAFSSSSYTFASIPSIISGLFPSQHYMRFFKEPRNLDDAGVKEILLKHLREDLITLPEILRGVLDYKIFFYSGGISLAEKSIKEIFPLVNSKTIHASQEIDKVISLLKKYDKRFYIHLHISDTHQPLYVPKEIISTLNITDYSEKVRIWCYQEASNLNSHDFIIYKKKKNELYDATILYIDKQIERLYNYLKDDNLIDNTIVVITADHGEEFWDHAEIEKRYFYDPRGYFGVGHGHNMFNEVIKVPLIIFGCCIKSGTYRYNVSAVDIVPTLLDSLNLEYNPKIFEGNNLFNKPMEKRPIIVEDIAYGYDKLALIINNIKYLISIGDDIFWKFNLKKDPFEKDPEVIDRKEINEIIKLIKFKSVLKPKIDNSTVLGRLLKNLIAFK